eukprot:TRINITY_DN7200_c0_g2_i2.p1 TRINITY_DN7200_c0_g2~~TRINITY_DN7200_c0_g2_i2.p1  ORF type:complete len:407 (+),score=67.82 TRINITY_DN7200_c0_g2_i2:490-1710(+)
MLSQTRMARCAFRQWAAVVREDWRKSHGKNNPLFNDLKVKYWETIPAMPEGCHVMDIAGVFQEDAGFKDLNEKLQNIKNDTGVDVRMYLLGDAGSHVTKELSRNLGIHLSKSTKHHNTITIVMSRKNGTLDTYPGAGVAHIVNRYWVDRQFKKIFKVYFKGREWDVKLLEYAGAIDATTRNNKRFILTTGPPILPFLYKYWHAILISLILFYIKASEYLEYYKYWDVRWCSDCKIFMEGHPDDEMLWNNLTLGQKKEVELDCVKYALWKCPTVDCENCFVEEVKWNSLRNDCLICIKCRHRTSWGRRVVGATPDEHNTGEAINMRTCKFCGFEEAWLSLIPANLGSGVTPDHDRQTVGSYGGKWEQVLHTSFLGKFIFPGAGSPAAEIRRGGVGELSDKTTTYYHK